MAGFSGSQITRLGLYGGTRGLYGDFTAKTPATIAALTGTAVDGVLESEIVAGGETIVITLTNDTWVADDGTFAGIRQDIIDGLDSDGAEATGWNAEVRDKEVVGAVVRTSDTVVTITLSAAAAYSITADETITVTVPASALVTSASAVEATTTFDVTNETPTVVSDVDVFAPGRGGDRVRRRRHRRDRDEIVAEVRSLYEGVREEIVATGDEGAADVLAEVVSPFASTSAADLPAPREIDWVAAAEETAGAILTSVKLVQTRIIARRRQEIQEEEDIVTLLLL